MTKPKEQRRTEVIGVRVTKSELAALTKEARIESKQVATWVRDAALVMLGNQARDEAGI